MHGAVVLLKGRAFIVEGGEVIGSHLIFHIVNLWVVIEHLRVGELLIIVVIILGFEYIFQRTDKFRQTSVRARLTDLLYAGIVLF